MTLESLNLCKGAVFQVFVFFLVNHLVLPPPNQMCFKTFPWVYMHPSVKTDFMAKVSGREIARLATVTFIFDPVKTFVYV